jgi:SAM-dependent methyltransferase
MGFSLPLDRAASLCCGAGAVERGLVKSGLLQGCVGFDLAQGALDAARAAADAEGVAGLSYERRDLERDGLGLSHLDLVLAHQGVHHIYELEAVFDSVYGSLRPGGVFHLHEFVDADRFQWPDRQVQEMTDWLQSLPKRYQITRGGLVKSCAGRATIEEMIAYDPSEAVRSSAIEPLVSERFEILERRALGGTLAMMALADIGQNFNPNVPEDAAHIERLLAREDELMASGEIGSDFAIIVARKRPD